MKYFTLILAFLFSVVVTDLVGQSTVVIPQGHTTKDGFIVQDNPLEPYFVFGDTADAVDTVTGVLTLKSYSEDYGEFTLHLTHRIEPGHAPVWYVFIKEGVNSAWYVAQPFFNTTGCYKIQFIDGIKDVPFGEVLITVTGLTIGFKSNSVMPTHGYRAYTAYTGIKDQPNSKPHYFYIRNPGRSQSQKTN